LKSVIAVWWILAGPYVYKIFVAFTIFVLPRSQKTSYSLLTEQDEEQAQRPASLFRDECSKRKLFSSMIKYIYRCQPGEKPYYFGLGFVLWAFVFFCFWNVLAVGVSAFLGPLVAFAQADTSALWGSDQCGIWEYNSEANGGPATHRNDVLNRAKEARAGDYAQACYLSSGLSSSMRCKSFYRKEIEFSNQTTDCPFPDPEVCMKGKYSISFDTGIVDSGVIGINSKNTYKFRRRTICAPLVQEPFVRKVVEDGTEEYFYEYGKKYSKGRPHAVTSNYTYNTWGDPYYVPAGGYDV
jgi:hypothetical protein